MLMERTQWLSYEVSLAIWDHTPDTSEHTPP